MKRETDAYFDELRRALRGLHPTHVQEIIAELEAHVAERAATMGREAAITMLGDPRELAALYKATDLTSQSLHPSPWRLLHAAKLLAKLSLTGAFALIGTVLGYLVGMFLIAAALIKPFMPDRVGLWISDYDDPAISFGRAAVPGGDEVLGWWMIPICLFLGLLTVYLAWRWSLAAVRKILRAAKRSKRSILGESMHQTGTDPF